MPVQDEDRPRVHLRKAKASAPAGPSPYERNDRPMIEHVANPGAADMSPTHGRIQSNQDRRPVPDPTVLTVQMILRESVALRSILEIRLDGMDRAIMLIQANADKSPTIAELYARHDERFRSIETQFAERDTRTEQTSKDSKVAVDAALQAAKEAVGEQNKSSALAIAKSETATTKQIDQQATLLQNVAKAIDDKIDDMKQRLTTIEGRAAGGNALWGYILGGFGLLSAIITLAVKVAQR